VVRTARPAAQDPASAAEAAALDRHVSDLEEGVRREAAMEDLCRAGVAGAEAVGRWLATERLVPKVAMDAACRVLEGIGPAAAPQLEKLVDRYYREDGAPHRARILAAMSWLGPFDPDARDTWHKRLKEVGDLGSALRVDGFFLGIGAMSVPGQATVQELVDLLNDANPYYRMGAARVVAWRAREWESKDRASLLKALTEALELPIGSFNMTWDWGGGNASTSGSVDSREAKRVRATLCLAIARLDPAHAKAPAGHAQRFLHPDPAVAVQAMALVMTHPDGGDDVAVEALIEALEDPRPVVAREAATVLGVVGRGHDGVLPALRRAAEQGRDDQLARRAEAAARALGGGP